MSDNFTSRERYLAAFRHEEPDRVPIFLDANALVFFTDEVKWYNQFERAEVLLRLGCDPMINIWLPTPVPHPDVKIRTWREKRPDGTIYIGKEFDTPKGTLRQIVQETPDWCDYWHGLWVQRTLAATMRVDYGMHLFDDWNVSRRTEPWVKGPDDLPKLPYILQKPPQWQLDEWTHDAQRAKEFAQKHDLLTMVRRTIVSDAWEWFCDIPWFAMQLCDDPGFVEEFLNIFEAAAAWQAPLALDVGVDVFQRRGWYDLPEFWGGRNYERYILPSVNREAELTHQAGALHCYLVTKGWGTFLQSLRKLESDILWGADPLAGGAPLATMKEHLREKTILGGISCEKQLAQGSEAAVREAVRKAISALAPGGGFVLASSSSVFHESKWANVAAMIGEAHRVGRYPIGVSTGPDNDAPRD